MLLCRRFNLFYFQKIWTEDRACKQIIIKKKFWQCSFGESQIIAERRAVFQNVTKP